MRRGEALFAVGSARKQEFTQALAERCSFREEKRPRWTTRVHDTFDWRLYGAGGLLVETSTPRGTVLSWTRFDGSVRYRLPVATVPGFVRDFPAGAFRRALQPIVEMRRLAAIVELETSATVWHCLDGNRKTVVRLRWEERAARAADGGTFEALPSLLRVVPLRGYDEARDRAVRFLAEELGFEATAPDWDRVLRVGGREPGAYSSKLRLELDAAMPAAAAARQIHRTLLETIRTNEDGVRRDLDSEFLHDFRVAVRRTRAALGQIKGVFPEPAQACFRRELSWLGQLTGPTRDLDVYLLKFGDYEAALPPAVRRDLEPLRGFLAAEQRREQRRLATALGGARYRRLLADWQAFLEDERGPGPGDQEPSPPNAGRPIVEVAGRRIRKVYRRVLDQGRAIGDDSPDESLHRLRIECKKLRYLLEFFRGLYPSPEVDPLIKALKKLQDNLGDFNDYSVQQKQLKDFARRMLDEGVADADTSMAMGALVAHLERGQAAERRAFHRRFATFARRGNRDRFQALFHRSTG
jgi:CHAD domain-containing protein